MKGDATGAVIGDHEVIDWASLGLAPGGYDRPTRTKGIVERPALVDRMLAIPEGDVVVVSAPAGYGKTMTTLLWDTADPRPFAWVHLDGLDNDPVHLVRHVAGAIDQVHPVGPDIVPTLIRPGASAELDLLPTLTGAIRDIPAFVLVLDDVHLLDKPAAVDMVSALLTALPACCQVVLVGRTTANLRLARHRMGRGLTTIDAASLAMADRDAERLFNELGLQVTPGHVRALVERTEGWPGGLHLSALALARDGRSEPDLLTGRDELVGDYLLEEVLDGLPDDDVAFLERSSVLSRMSAASLDGLLDRDDSGRQLEAIRQSGNLFLVPLDREQTWYRYHHLFGEMLRHRLHRRDPRGASELERKASAQLEAAGDLDGAIDHAVHAGDIDRAADLVLRSAYSLFMTGRVHLLGHRLAQLGPDAWKTHATIAIATAWWAIGVPDATLVQQALDAAARAGHEGPLADGSPSLDVAMAALRALAGNDGVPGVVRDTQIVIDAPDPESNPWYTSAVIIQGTALSMLGSLDEARERFLTGLARSADAPLQRTTAQAHLALLALYDDDLVEAERLSTEAVELTERFDLGRILLSVPVYAIAALVEARCHRPESSRMAAANARLITSQLDTLSPRSVLLVFTLLAKAALARGEVGLARTRAREARRAQRNEMSALRLNQLLDEVEEQIETAVVTTSGPLPTISSAELRVLRYLPTHLSLGEIAEQLVVSRNTAKSHTVSIYRKLGVSSRSHAVIEARRLGILTD